MHYSNTVMLSHDTTNCLQGKMLGKMTHKHCRCRLGKKNNTHRMRYLFAWSANRYVLNFGTDHESIVTAEKDFCLREIIKEKMLKIYHIILICTLLLETWLMSEGMLTLL